MTNYIDREMEICIGEYVLQQTCSMCPEQYFCYKSGDVVGYLRLRGGYFSVECPDVGGQLVYEGLPLGDGFFRGEERPVFLQIAVAEIDKWVKAQ